MVIRAGNHVQERLDGAAERADTRGLSIEGIARQPGDAVVGAEGIVRSRRSELPTHTRYDFDQHAQQDADTLLGTAGLAPDSDTEFYRLDDQEVYVVSFAEAIDVPEGSIGYVTPQSNLLQCGVSMDATALGPEDDEAEAVLSLQDGFVLLEDAAEIAELVVLEVADE